MALNSNQRQIIALKAFVDSFITPLKAKSGSEQDDVITCAMLEAFLWISTGVKVKAFDEDLAKSVVKYFLQEPLSRTKEYEKAILKPEHVEEFLSFQQSGFIWQGTMTETGDLIPAFQALAMSSAQFVNQYSVRTLIRGLRFANEQVWKQMTSQRLDDDTLVEQFYETHQGTANDLTRCAIGAFATMTHVAAFEAVSPQLSVLLRRLRSIRDWGFGFGSVVAESRFLTVIKEIDQYANALATRALGRKIVDSLVPAAKEAMQVWHRGTLGVMVAGKSH